MDNRQGVRVWGQALLWLVVCGPTAVWAQASQQADAADDSSTPAFDYQERSTLNTTPFRPMGEDSLADTAIEGGLEAPAPGVAVTSVQSAKEAFYLDPLALKPGDSRTDLGRSEVPVEFRFSNPKVVPGQTFGNNYVIRPPSNRTYDTFNTNVQGR
ncbi:MAG: hypothetical protein R3303_02245 [Marinobacter sp.]|nr:hypothetical protein [Marinobacter sp.]